MAEQFLFAAEVDKIQDTLFRGAAQRQVVGGSRLLVEFGQWAKELARRYGATNETILVTAGGNFRILFPHREHAEAFGRELADGYRLLLDATMTVAPPQPVTDAADFVVAHRRAQQAIRRGKQTGRQPVATPHAPTTAFCASSGVGLASDFVRLGPPVSTARPNYVADFALRTYQAGNIRHEAEGDEPETESFLGRIKALLPEEMHDWDWGDAEEIAGLDGQRANVAYLVADGNGIGELFGDCDRAELRQLSTDLDEAIRQALAAARPAGDAPIVALQQRLRDGRRLKDGWLPLLPLILAGDEVFILLPALYALDFARRFCLAFEHFFSRSDVVQQLVERGWPRPTMGAAVVICKGSYPYRLAYNQGKALLADAKRLAKTVGQPSDQRHSALAFAQIVGSELVGHGRQAAGFYRPSLGPYWLAEGTLAPAAAEAGLELADLLTQRWLLHGLPQKRLAELSALFDPAALPAETGAGDATETLRQKWNPQLRRLLERTAASSNHRPSVELALRELGDGSDLEVVSNPGHWREVFRPGQASYRGHGLPDLLAIWNYAHSFDYALDDYKEGE